jgi:enolase
MAKIKQIVATEILDSRGNPTVEATVILNDGAVGIAASPSGSSTSSYEALELRDHDDTRYTGLGVLKAITNIDTIISPALVGMEASKQADIDKRMIELDGTQNKGRLGGNAMLAISMAVAKASAKSAVLPLFLYLRQFIKTEHESLKMPTPLFNVLNGGKHASGNVDFQEFIIIPASSKTYQEGLQLGVNIYNTLRTTLKNKGLSTMVGDEGGFAPDLPSNKDAFNLVKTAIEQSQYRYGFDVFLGCDVASSTFFDKGQYHLKDKSSALSSKDLTAYYLELLKEYPLLYLEDPLSEDDWDGWIELANACPPQTMLIGDDLISTNPYRLQMALEKKVVSGVIIKPNQIGTVIEALAVVEVAREADLKIVVSHRSGETDDDFIADFAVAVSADYAKFGAPARGERVAKYNRLTHIEKQLKSFNTITS